MQVAFEENTLPCLQRAAWEVKHEEYTQEVKVPDNMPDIGRVLGVWGQPVVRSKTWHGNGMTVSGGVLAWILYTPEGEASPQMIESWLPYQLRWDFAQTQQDGSILIRTLLEALDARTITPRKLILRGVVCTAGEALIPDVVKTWSAGELPDGVHVLQRRYPVTVPTEAAEKVFSIEEAMPLPAGCEHAEKVLYHSVKPEVADCKIMADKLVFRGSVKAKGMCYDRERGMEPFCMEAPFSQYVQLQREYGEEAEAMLLPEVSNVELELSEAGTLRLAADVIGQYVIFDHPVLEIVEDVYCPSKAVTPQWQTLELPAILDCRQTVLRAEESMQIEGDKILDAAMFAAHPSLQRQGETVRLQQPYGFRGLWMTPEGEIQSGETSGAVSFELDADGKTKLMAWSHPSPAVQATFSPGQLQLRGEITVHTVTVLEQTYPMITALEMGQAVAQDPDRPSLILRRVGQDSLWKIAKNYGSTVEALREANGLTGEPEPERILLIPMVNS